MRISHCSHRTNIITFVYDSAEDIGFVFDGPIKSLIYPRSPKIEFIIYIGLLLDKYHELAGFVLEKIR